VVAAGLAVAAVEGGMVWANGASTGAKGPAYVNASVSAGSQTSSRERSGQLTRRVRAARTFHVGSLLQQRVGNDVIVGHSYKHLLSRPLRSLPRRAGLPSAEREASPNPKTGRAHDNAPDGARQAQAFAPKMQGTMLNFEGTPFPGVNCFCAPPDTNGEVGSTQYVQIVNQALQVFDKSDGSSLLGPIDIASLWNNFGDPCESDGNGDPVVLYDQLANRWVVSQFAGFNLNGTVTDECIAVSTSANATGTWNLYGFHLGTNFFDYPKLGVWPDAYYMSMNVFDPPGNNYLGPQPFAFDRTAMLAGNPLSTFITTGITNGPTEDPYLPADLDGSTAPPANAPNPFVEFPGNNPSTYRVYRFHVDFVTPANSTFILATPAPSAAAFTLLTSRVPQLGTADGLDALADRLMFRAAYRNLGGGNEALVSNYTVSSNGVAGVRWFELNHVTSGGAPSVVQESTYQPDNTWRWMGSAAMDGSGDLAVGYSASSAAIHPEIRYAGRLSSDPLNTLGQGETTLFAGKGSQSDTVNRWGDYSDLTIDPVDDCTFWYTNEYLADTGTFNWRTRIGNFKFPGCGPAAAAVSITKTADAGQVNSGSQIGFTVTLKNSGDAQATGLSITDDLPAGSGINWSIDGANSDPEWSVVGSPPNQSLAYSQPTLDVNETTHVHVVSGTTNASGGQYDNTASFTTDNGTGSDSASTVVVAPPPCGSPEDFGNVNSLPGWSMQNNSSPLGSTGWFQGNDGVFPSQAGASDAYIAANFNNTGAIGTISNWLLTPTLSLQNREQLIFFTRTSEGSNFPDRLQVRMSTNGASTNVGGTATSVGDFGALLLDINPTYAIGGYPESWTQYTVTISGVPSVVVGRLAFRYFVEDGGPAGDNSNYIGIDTVCTPPAGTPPPPPPPPPAHWTLNVFKAGAGAGTVTSSPAGVNCGPVCTAQFSNGTSVTLTAAASSSSKFSGWSGDCSGTATTCVLSMTADHTMTATFAKKPKCKVPKGVGLTLAKAKSRIRRAHCGVGKISKKFSSRKKKGRVLSQKPRPGKTLPAGSKVNLTVGKGPKH
jgi:uncharacterized repeat protein (TIGR01451 family)